LGKSRAAITSDTKAFTEDMPDKKHFIGIDLGGTNIKSALVNT